MKSNRWWARVIPFWDGLFSLGDGWLGRWGRQRQNGPCKFRKLQPEIERLEMRMMPAAKATAGALPAETLARVRSGGLPAVSSRDAASNRYTYARTPEAGVPAGGGYSGVLWNDSVASGVASGASLLAAEGGDGSQVGDGAGAVVLEASETAGVRATALHADGSHHPILCVPGGVASGQVIGDPFLRMDGQAVFKFAVKVLGDGEVKGALKVKADKFSRAAREKIEAAGGTCTES